MRNTRLWVGLTKLFAFLLAVVIVGSNIANGYAAQINNVFGIITTKVVNPGDPDYPGGETVDDEEKQYFKSEFGEFTQENQTKMINAAYEQAVNEMKEGAALLYNKDNALPLDKSTETLSLFGRATVVTLAAHTAAGTRPQAGYYANIHDAMKDEGFTVNEELYNILVQYPNPGIATPEASSLGTITTGTANVEDPIDVYNDAAKATWANSSNEVAVYTITRSGAESVDMLKSDPNNGGRSSLSLHDKEIAILEMLKAEKEAGRIKKIIVLLNTGNPLEVYWLEDYAVDACLFIGSVGSQGARGAASILSGETNPSGHLVDTYAVNSLSAPATVNAHEDTPKFTNAEALIAQLDADRPENAKYGDAANGQYMSFQAEGIYIGYKYYETRYEDAILGQGNATGAAGASNGASQWQYENEVSFPFGHGLSYTTFAQKIDNVAYNEETDTYDVTVTVENTGSVAGKSVVQVYAQTPYGYYEKQNKVEKSAVQLVDFGKTKLLEPGEKEQLTINVDRYLLASYDYVGAKGYILSEGDYYLAIGENAHDALNNILAAKTPAAAGLINYDGTAFTPSEGKTYTFHLSFDDQSYKLSSTGVEVTNRFDNADLNYWEPGSGIYLSRSDWQGTFPTTQTSIAASDEMAYLLKGDYYTKPEDAPSLSSVTDTLGKNEGISFVSMKDVPWDDYVMWDKFLRQMTLDELLSVVECSNGRASVAAVTLPDTLIADGVDGVMKANPMTANGYIYDYEDTTGTYGSGVIAAEDLKSVRYPSKTILTMTFNRELYQRRGELMGEESLWSNGTKGLVELFGIGVDLHRTPFGGRGIEYCSEDANMTYLATIPEVIGLQAKGTLASVKHVAGNDQEFERHGVCIFFNEQAWREGSLRAVEGAIRIGQAHSLMQSFNRLGPVWSSSSRAMNEEVIRGEWGFTGHMETDGTDGQEADHYGFMGHYATALWAGSDTFCLNVNAAAPTLKAQIEDNDDGELANHVIRAAKNFFYAMSRCNAVNGLSSSSVTLVITPWWQTALTAATVSLGVLAAVSLLLAVVSKLKKASTIKEGGK